MRGRLFSVGLIPALLGFFGAGGALQEVCCFAGLLMLPHYINDFFCCAQLRSTPATLPRGRLTRSVAANRSGERDVAGVREPP